MARAERRGGASILGQVVVGEHDDYGFLDLIGRNGAQHAETRALAQVEIEQHHIDRLPLQHCHRIGFAVHGTGQLHPGDAEQSFAQPFSQHARILHQQYR